MLRLSLSASNNKLLPARPVVAPKAGLRGFRIPNRGVKQGLKLSINRPVSPLVNKPSIYSHQPFGKSKYTPILQADFRLTHPQQPNPLSMSNVITETDSEPSLVILEDSIDYLDATTTKEPVSVQPNENTDMKMNETSLDAMYMLHAYDADLLQGPFNETLVRNRIDDLQNRMFILNVDGFWKSIKLEVSIFFYLLISLFVY